MNRVILTGRPTRDPEIRYTTGEKQMCIAAFTLAVDRRSAKDREQSADFISCKAFGKLAEFCEKYITQGRKIAIEGRLNTGSYEKDGRKVYYTEVNCDTIEFADSKPDGSGSKTRSAAPADEGFMNIPDGDYEGLPFN